MTKAEAVAVLEEKGIEYDPEDSAANLKKLAEEALAGEEDSEENESTEDATDEEPEASKPEPSPVASKKSPVLYASKGNFRLMEHGDGSWRMLNEKADVVTTGTDLDRGIDMLRKLTRTDANKQIQYHNR